MAGVAMILSALVFVAFERVTVGTRVSSFVGGRVGSFVGTSVGGSVGSLVGIHVGTNDGDADRLSKAADVPTPAGVDADGADGMSDGVSVGKMRGRPVPV